MTHPSRRLVGIPPPHREGIRQLCPPRLPGPLECYQHRHPGDGPQTVTLRASPLQQLVRAVIHTATFSVAYIIICIFIGAGLGKFLCDTPRNSAPGRIRSSGVEHLQVRWCRRWRAVQRCRDGGRLSLGEVIAGPMTRRGVAMMVGAYPTIPLF